MADDGLFGFYYCFDLDGIHDHRVEHTSSIITFSIDDDGPMCLLAEDDTTEGAMVGLPVGSNVGDSEVGIWVGPNMVGAMDGDSEGMMPPFKPKNVKAQLLLVVVGGAVNSLGNKTKTNIYLCVVMIVIVVYCSVAWIVDFCFCSGTEQGL